MITVDDIMKAAELLDKLMEPTEIDFTGELKTSMLINDIYCYREKVPGRRQSCDGLVLRGEGGYIPHCFFFNKGLVTRMFYGRKHEYLRCEACRAMEERVLNERQIDREQR